MAEHDYEKEWREAVADNQRRSSEKIELVLRQQEALKASQEHCEKMSEMVIKQTELHIKHIEAQEARHNEDIAAIKDEHDKTKQKLATWGGIVTAFVGMITFFKDRLPL